jgi:lysine-N-methylase
MAGCPFIKLQKEGFNKMNVQSNVPTRKKIVLAPQYMEKFQCIGSECEDSCCVGWHVTIDELTYKKYNKVRDAELKPLLDKKVTRNRSNPDPQNYAKIKMDSQGCCSFLSEDKLCKIQLKLGEDYLSNTCSTYPRIMNEVNGVLEKSATMSCPEAARLALLNRDGIEFDEVEVPINSHQVISAKIETKDKKVQHKAQKYFWELRIFTIQVLQDRSYHLWERLILLGIFYQRIQEYIETNQAKEIPNHIAAFTNVMSERSLRENLEQIPVKHEVQMKIAKKLADERFLQGFNNQRYMECYFEMMQGIHYITGTTYDVINEHYVQSYQEHYLPFMAEHEYILENYLVNYAYKNLVPFGGGYGSVFDEYVMMVVHYSFIKLHLIGMAGFNKGLNTDLVIKMIQSFAKVVEHNKLFLRNILNLLKDNEYTTMAYMSVLIKN